MVPVFPPSGTSEPGATKSDSIDLMRGRSFIEATPKDEPMTAVSSRIRWFRK
jgi:hypothetical protein